MRVAAMPLSTSSFERSTSLQGNYALRTLVITLVLSLLLLAAATEWLVRTQVVPQDTFSKHLRLLQTTTQRDASFGDSHVARGFDASNGFVNLAYPSENIEYMYWKMRTFFDARPPGRVIVQADPHIFAPYRVNAPFRPYVDSKPFKAPVLYSATARHRPQLIAYWSAFLNGFGQLESKVQQTENGALLSKGDLSAQPLRKRQAEARLRIQTHRHEQSQAVVIAQARYFEMISFLAAKGAQICLVSFPVSPDYIAALADADQQTTPSGHANAIQFFEEMAAQTGARYIDARAQITNLALFRDVDHLNVEGAGIFSSSLIRQCFED
jgi:hypothetical protein